MSLAAWQRWSRRQASSWWLAGTTTRWEESRPARALVGVGSNHRLGYAGPTFRRWRDWVHREPALATLTYQRLRGVLADADRSGAEHDRLLGALMRLAQESDATAGAVVICCLRPGLLARCMRSGHGLGREDALAEMTAALWEAIRSYPIGTRPEHVASRLLAVAEQRLRDRARSARHRNQRVVPLGVTDIAGADGAELRPEALLANAVAAGVITRNNADLITEVDIRGLDLGVASRLHGLSYETAKKRRQRTLGRLAAWLTNPPVAAGRPCNVKRAQWL